MSDQSLCRDSHQSVPSITSSDSHPRGCKGYARAGVRGYARAGVRAHARAGVRPSQGHARAGARPCQGHAKATPCGWKATPRPRLAGARPRQGHALRVQGHALRVQGHAKAMPCACSVLLASWPSNFQIISHLPCSSFVSTIGGTMGVLNSYLIRGAGLGCLQCDTFMHCHTKF